MVVDLGSSFGSGLFHAVTVAVGDDDVAVVEEPVEHGDGGGVFGQETPPGFEWPVRAEAEGAAFVGGGDEPKHKGQQQMAAWIGDLVSRQRSSRHRRQG